MYGRGAASIAEQIHGSKEDAQKIIDDFFISFPDVKKWMDKTLVDARKNGYVSDLWGRRRRLPDILLKKYEISSSTELNEFNPFLGCKDRLDSQVLKQYQDIEKKLSNAKFKKDVNKIQQDALKEGITIKDNSGFIAQAERQCVNARIQGGAATMTKIAMIRLFNDIELRKLGFKLLIGVHDELIGECPKMNADEVANRLTYLMKTSIENITDVPFKCDADICDHWYLNDYIDTLQKDVDTYSQSMSHEEAINKVISEHPEQPKEFLLTKLN